MRLACLSPRRAFPALVKLLIGLMFSLSAALAWAQGINFSTTVGMAALCLDDLEPGFLYNTLRKLKAPSRHEQGAYWFTIAEPLFTAPVSEVFVSDGAKCDTANIQEIFAQDIRLAIPDPVYPVYLDRASASRLRACSRR